MQLSVHIPTLLLVGSYFIVPESVRWLNSKEKYDEVVKKLSRQAATNKKFNHQNISGVAFMMNL